MTTVKNLLMPNARALSAQRLYITCVDAARHPFFYQHTQVADTVNGRLEMIMLHVALVLVRLKTNDARHEAESQALIEAFFQDMDTYFRDSGVGDLKIGKKVRKLADLLYGRLGAYDAALADNAPQAALADAILRNVFRDVEVKAHYMQAAAQLAAYMRNAHAALATQPTQDILQAKMQWPIPAL